MVRVAAAVLRAARANQHSYNQSNKLACSVKEVKREKNKKQTNLLVCFWLECKLPLVSIKWLRDDHCNGWCRLDTKRAQGSWQGDPE